MIKTNLLIIILLTIIVIILIGSYFIFFDISSLKKETPKPTKELKQYNTQPPISIDRNKHYIAILKTSLGDITIQLNAKTTPITVNNFIFLAKEGFYNQTIFHRVIKNFMIQGGDPLGTGMGVRVITLMMKKLLENISEVQ